MKRLSVLLTLVFAISATALYAQDANTIFSTAKSNYDAKSYQAAADGFKRYTEMVPSDYAGFYNLGLSYYYLGRYADSTIPFKEALRIKPDNYKGWV